MKSTDRLLTLRDVKALTTLSKPTIYKLIKIGGFPKQLRIAHQKVAWLDSEVRDWVTQRALQRGAE